MRIHLSYVKDKGKHFFRADYGSSYCIAESEDLSEKNIVKALRELKEFLVEEHG